MTSPIAESFASLIKSIHDDRTLLQSLSALRPTPDGSIPEAARLHDIDDTITNLEARLHEIQNFITSEREALGNLVTLKDKIDEQRSLVEDTNSLIGDNPLLPSSSPTDDHKRSSTNERPGKQKAGIVPLATKAEFEAVPTTTRERTSLEEINSVVVALQGVLTSRVSLFSLPKAAVGKKYMTTWLAYHRRKNLTGASSITLTEAELYALTPVLGKSSRGRQRALVSTLRHLKRLKQVQEEGSLLYVIADDLY